MFRESFFWIGAILAFFKSGGNNEDAMLSLRFLKIKSFADGNLKSKFFISIDSFKVKSFLLPQYWHVNLSRKKTLNLVKLGCFVGCIKLSPYHILTWIKLNVQQPSQNWNN